MRKVLLPFGAMLLFSVAARAQDTGWQLGIGYQYNRIVPLAGKPTVNTNGLHASVVRFIGSSPLGIEGDIGVGFGHTGTTTVPNNLEIKTASFSGGAHLAFSRNSRIEPWFHGLVGLEHFRFTQTATFGGVNALDYTIGGGIDWHLNPRTAIRAEADYLGTRLSGSAQNNFQLVVGLVFNL
jgi:hypothetical protein